MLNKSIPAINILEILSFEDFDDSMIKEFFELVGLDTESEVSVFDRCKEKKVNNNVVSGTDSICNERDLIIDSTIFGMGRGAGNIHTEHLIQYLNDNYTKDYNLIPILKTIDEIINPIYKITPWGYSVPYYLAATNNCHPNYAKFLSDKKIDVEQIDFLLKNIPEDKKLSYDTEYIKNILKKN